MRDETKFKPGDLATYSYPDPSAEDYPDKYVAVRQKQEDDKRKLRLLRSGLLESLDNCSRADHKKQLTPLLDALVEGVRRYIRKPDDGKLLLIVKDAVAKLIPFWLSACEKATDPRRALKRERYEKLANNIRIAIFDLLYLVEFKIFASDYP